MTTTQPPSRARFVDACIAACTATSTSAAAAGQAALSSSVSELQTTLPAEQLITLGVEVILLAPGETQERALPEAVAVALQFQAALLVRQAVVDSWERVFKLDDNAKAQLRSSLFGLVLEGKLLRVVWLQLLHVIGISYKLDWDSPSNSNVRLLAVEIPGLLNEENTRGIGLAFLKALVSEFSQVAASPVRLPLEFHNKASLNFEKYGLFEALSLALSLIDARARGTCSIFDNSLQDALDIIELCISWDFQIVGSSGRRLDTESRIKIPYQQWSALVNTTVVDMFFELYRQYRFSNIDVARGIKQVLLLLSGASLSLPKNGENENKGDEDEWAFNYATSFARSVFLVLSSPIAPLKSTICLVKETFESIEGEISKTLSDRDQQLLSNAGEEVLSMCTILHTLSSAHIALFLSRLNHPNTLFFFENLSKFTCLLLEGLAAKDADIEENSWAMEALDVLLLTFAKCCDSESNQPEPVLQKYLGEVFNCYIAKRLDMSRRDMSLGMGDADDGFREYFEDPSAFDEHLLSVAAIGRHLAPDSLLLLSSSIDDALSRQNSDSSVACDQLYWLVLWLSYLLADSGRGERPMVPNILNIISQRHSISNAQDPVVFSSLTLIKVLRSQVQLLESITGAQEWERLSPLLVSKAFWAVSRWADTYLFPSLSLYSGESSSYGSQLMLSPSICAAFGVSGFQGTDENRNISSFQAVSILDMLVRDVNIVLSRWSGESSVTNEALGMLRTATQSKDSRLVVMGLKSYEELITAHIASMNSLDSSSVTSPVYSWGVFDRISQGSLHLTICSTLGASTESDLRLFEAVVQPMENRLRLLGELLHVSSQPKGFTLWAIDANRVCDLYRGFIKASSLGDCGKKVRYVFIRSLDIWKVLFLELCQRSGSVNREGVAESSLLQSNILTLLQEFLEIHLVFAESSSLPALFQTSYEIIDAYVKVSSQRIKAQKGDDEEFALDMSNILKILIQVSDRDVLDFDGEIAATGDQSVDATQVAILGFHRILPLINEPLLQHNHVADDFFSLVTGIIKVQPRKVASLDPSLFSALFRSIDFGINHQLVDVARRSLEALSSLCFHHIKTGDLAPQLQQNPDLFSYFIKKLLDLTIYQSLDSSLTNPCASALLALIMCDEKGYTTVVQSILTSIPNTESRYRLEQALTKLTRSNGVQLSQDRRNQQAFQKNLSQFQLEVRQFSQVR